MKHLLKILTPVCVVVLSASFGYGQINDESFQKKVAHDNGYQNLSRDRDSDGDKNRDVNAILDADKTPDTKKTENHISKNDNVNNTTSNTNTRHNVKGANIDKSHGSRSGNTNKEAKVVLLLLLLSISNR